MGAGVNGIRRGQAKFRTFPDIPFLFRFLPNYPVGNLRNGRKVIYFFRGDLPVPSYPIISRDIQSMSGVLLCCALFIMGFMCPFTTLCMSRGSVEAVRLEWYIVIRPL